MKSQFPVMIDKVTHKKVKLMSAVSEKSMGDIIRIAVGKLDMKEFGLTEPSIAVSSKKVPKANKSKQEK